MNGDDIRVRHDGLTFRCRLDGQEGAPWVVFGNSMLTDLTVWDAQVAALGDRCRILRYDQRGHGLTDVPPGPADFDQLGGDLLALLDHFGIERCAYVGLSMGVTTGLHLVAHHPERVARLVLSDGLAASPPTGRETWEGRIADARRLGMRGLAEVTMERWFSPEFRAAGKHGRALETAAATPLEGFVACAHALQSYDLAGRLGRIALPTLLMAGANDGPILAAMRPMAEAIPGAVLHVVPDAGHIPNVEQPRVFNRHLLDFLA